MSNGRRSTIAILGVLLAISVGLNLFVLGTIVGGRWMNRPVAAAVEAVMRAYPPAVRDKVRQKLFDDRDVVRTAFADLGESRRKMFALMRAEPLDVEALQKAMAEVREKTTLVQTMLQSALLLSLKEVPVAEREKIVPPRLGLGIGRLRDDAR